MVYFPVEYINSALWTEWEREREIKSSWGVWIKKKKPQEKKCEKTEGWEPSQKKISIVAPVEKGQSKLPSATVSLCREVTEEHPQWSKEQGSQRSMDLRQLWGPGSIFHVSHLMRWEDQWFGSKQIPGRDPLYKWIHVQDFTFMTILCLNCHYGCRKGHC